MSIYREKLVETEARQIPALWPVVGREPDAVEAARTKRVTLLAEWCGGWCGPVGIKIPTLEGTHIASPGDYIIKGVAGKFYPCKPEIFAATYEFVKESEA